MKRCLLFILATISSQVFSQITGNEWINFSQKYFRITVTANGIYHLSYSDLTNAGIPLGGIDPRNLQLFHDGQEQYIYISGEGDGIFNNSDFLEFYGERNTGLFDTAFYLNPKMQVNPNFSLYTDTSSYFLTWNNSWANRRMTVETATDFSNYNTQNYCFKTVRQDFTTYYNSGEDGPYFNDGEGWVDSYFDYNSSQGNKTLSTPNYASVGEQTSVSFCIVGANSLTHHIKVSGPGFSFDTAYSSYPTIVKSFNTGNPLTSSTSVNAASIQETGSTTDKNSFAWVEIRYPHTLNFENASTFEFTLPPATVAKYRLEISSFNGDASTVLLDLTNHRRVNVTVDNNTFKVLLTSSGNSPRCVLVSGTDVKQISSIQPVKSKNSAEGYFTDFSGTKANYIIVSHAEIWDKAQDYSTYRTLSGFSTVLVDIEELYDQFGYGTRKHPGAIRNFCAYLMKRSSTRPEYLFLVGKSIHSSSMRSNKSYYEECKVPSAGQPSSDQLLTWRLNSSSYAPALATGRLVALDNSEVELYLDKVKDYESNTPAEWMKNVLQFGGGKDTYEQTMIKSFLQGYEATWKDTLFGGNVQAIYKNSSEPIETSQSDIVKQKINNGVSVMNFFGHAAATGFDQNIDLPSTYDNKGKYPFLIANSCYSGDYHTPGTRGLSESWILTKNKGAIGFLASAESGYAYYLNNFSSELVKGICYRFYNKPVGLSIKDAIRQNELQFGDNNYMSLTAVSMGLHGDPAIKINGFEKPDLYASPSFISFNPTRITNNIDSFLVNIVVTNIGRAFKDSFIVQLKRSFPNGKSFTKSIGIKGALYKDTISVTLPVGGTDAAGQNTLELTLDYGNKISELNEQNNTATVTFMVNSNDIIPVLPYKFAIIPNNTTEFVASSPDPFTETKNVTFQLDKTAYFNSGELFTSVKEFKGGNISFSYPSAFTANQVYYWRVGVDDGSGTMKWNTSSFEYIPGKTGWSQAEFNQFADDEYKYIDWNESGKDFSFIKTPRQIHVRNVGSPTQAQWPLTEFTLDGSLEGWSSCMAYPAINVFVMDSTTLDFWQTNRGNYGHRNYPTCLNGSVNSFFAFSSGDATARNNLANFLNDTVPNGDYLVFFSFISPSFASWEEKIINAFERLGAKMVRGASNDLPYIFFAKKGSPATAREVIGATAYSQIDMYQDIAINYVSGYVSSPTIGPSKRWESATFNAQPADQTADINLFSIGAITAKSEEIVVEDSILTEITGLDSKVSATAFPFLNLQMYTADKTSHSPGQLKAWRVFYDEEPEGAIDITNSYKFHADTLQEGDDMKLVISYRNVSAIDMDSILVNFNVKNEKNEVLKDITHRLAPLKAAQVATDSISVNTKNMAGSNSVVAEFNSFNALKGTYDQLEQYHFNNLAQKYFYVEKDKRNPLVDVTFDGVHILNGDIISAKPTISISLTDENSYFILDDTSDVEVYLKDMGTGTETRVQFTDNGSDGSMTFSAGTSKNNKASITYKPTFTKDGVYQLRVNGHDATGNESGDNDYTISFEVILKSTITNIINYPNPFTTATKFVYTVTGSEIPTDLRLQIFTITGKLVKQIVISDLGSIHIGRNITQLAWDGTDDFGDRLANGVYLYRVFSSINGEKIEHRSTDADKYFKKGFGKMYLMR